ncbi:sulfite exporter TauE/SafE family protein [Aminobacter anthyllidis]|uniref:sulfite exporter TauE/SafE family protein n=1 Tax=Aminobacter anthyllidis TaxID=1035067 RepID=UPI002456E69F|nr:sulfite exporter TauE/SafE family protein [Aminobacter anthyllidis]MDH4987724.1 sulfite exporter TauE/SafE family protein [Aminobacter anthyllidis]
MPEQLFLIIGAVFVLAGLVKGVVGLGLPTVAMGLLGLVMLPAEAAALLLLPSFVTNIWQLLVGPDITTLVRRLWPMMLAVFAATLASTGLITSRYTGMVTSGLGLVLLVYAALGLLKLRMSVPSAAEPWAGPVVGALTGIMTGATGVFVIPAVPYLGGLGLGRDDLVQALGLSFTVSTVALGIGLWSNDAIPLQSIGMSALAIVPALAGMWLGGWLRSRVEPESFRRWFFAGLALLGAHTSWQGLAPAFQGAIF